MKRIMMVFVTGIVSYLVSVGATKCVRRLFGPPKSMEAMQNYHSAANVISAVLREVTLRQLVYPMAT